MTAPLIHRASGTGDIAELAPPIQPNSAWSLVFVRIHFSRPVAGGPDTAAMTLAVHRDRDEKFNTLLYTIPGVGDDVDVNFRVGDDERDQWSFEALDQLRIAWTNPDAGNLWFALSVGYGFDA